MNSNGLTSAILAAAHDLDDPGRARLKTMLSLVAGTLSPTGTLPDDPDRVRALRSVVETLALLQRHGRPIPANGIAYRGRPAFMTDELLRALRAEARSVRAQALPQVGHFLGRGGTLADQLAGWPEMIELVESNTVPVTPTLIASYLYYEGAGAGLSAHVDTDVFALNVNIMLEHTAVAERRSFLYIYDTSCACEQIVLEPGEIVLTYADSIVHGRAPLADGEYVSNLTIGFQPQWWGRQ